MADFSTTDEVVWPSDNDIGPNDGDGDGLFEAQMAKWMENATQKNFVISGGTVPASSVDLNIDVAATEAVIDGRFVSIPGSTQVTATNNTTNYLYLKLTKSGDNVTSTEYEVNTTGTPPTDGVFLAVITAAAGAITATSDRRQTSPFTSAAGRTRVYTATGTFIARTNWVTVEMIGGGAGGGGGSGGSGAGGGGGGSFVKMEVAVTPGTEYTVTVGAGGALGTSGNNGSDGTDSWFGDSGNNASGGVKGLAAGTGGAGGSDTTASDKLALDGSDGSAGSGATGGAGGQAGGFSKPSGSYGDGGAGGDDGVSGVAGQDGLVIVYD